LAFPVQVSEITNPLDIYFSLGINKPLIPLKGQKITPDEIPSSPAELRKYLERHAEIIINESFIERSGIKPSFEQIDGAEEEGPEEEDDFKFLDINPPPPDHPEDFKFDSQNDKLPWEFGGDWKRNMKPILY